VQKYQQNQQHHKESKDYLHNLAAVHQQVLWHNQEHQERY
jgi:hypothetical protein